MNKNRLDNYLNKRKIGLPIPWLYDISKFFIDLFFLKRIKAEYYYHFDKEKMKGKQIILLADHSSFDNFYFALFGYPFVRFNIVMAYHHFFEYVLFYWYYLLNAIPKKLYETDLRTVRQMSKIISMGGSLCFFPEGTYSYSGSNQPINPSTMNFIKQLGVDVVLCKSYGAFCSRPVYRSGSAKGHREYHYEILFTKEELKEFSVDEIYDKMLKRFAYNDFKWEMEHQYPYYLKDGMASGMETFIYHCPKCGKDFGLKTDKDEIYCTCGNRVRINKHYKLMPIDNSVCNYKHYNEWYIDQRKIIKEEVDDPDFKVTYDCEAYDIHRDHLRIHPNYKCGEGKMTIDKSGMTYVGKRHGEDVKLFFDIKKTPCFRQDGDFNILYYNSEYFAFKPIGVNSIVKNMIIVEELHNKVDPIWGKAYKDAYD